VWRVVEALRWLVVGLLLAILPVSIILLIITIVKGLM
jgi:hypothetical protein